MAVASTYSESIVPVAPQEATPQETQTVETTPAEVITAPQNIETPTEQPQEDNSSVDFSFDLGDDQTTTSSPATSTPSLPQFDWKKELKNIPEEELYSEIGLTPFAVEINKHIKGGGAPIDYLQARAIDYDKFSDEGMAREMLRVENPTLSPKQIDLLFNRKYGINEDASDEDKEFVMAQLQSDAYKFRQAKKAEQQKFKIADAITPQKDEAYEAWLQNRTVQNQNLEVLRTFYQEHPSTKTLNDSKKVTINLGEGVEPFNFKVERPDLINRVLTDDGTAWNKLTSTTQGEPDVAKQQLLTLFAYDPAKFCQQIFNYGKQMGERQRVNQGQNAQRPNQVIQLNPEGQKTTYRTGTYGKGAN